VIEVSQSETECFSVHKTRKVSVSVSNMPFQH
jgi:hypothetical protein